MDPSKLPADMPEQRTRVREILKTLPAGVSQVTLICPLCGAIVPARSLRRRSLGGIDDALWQLVFTCPTCGLLTAFNTEGLSLERFEALSGSPWVGKLRQFQQSLRVAQPSYVRRATRGQLVGTFVVAFLAWMLLIGNFNPLEVAWGIIVSLIVARLTYRFAAIDLPGWMLHPRRWLALGLLFIEFSRQIIVQNITLSIRVLRPDRPIRPGIVAVPTALRDDVALTLLGSLMTLTPDTITMDIDQKKGIIYVHWIDVQTMDPDEAQRLVSASLEERIIRWLL